jgi:pyruvate dehydrogenase E2 component (dihydrolipoamide acetyltransferase)
MVTVDAVTRSEAPAPGWRVRLPRRVTQSFLSPVVRRLLGERNLDPTGVEGTGSGGRITRDDVLAIGSDGPSDDSVRLPLSPIRRKTADHLLRSKAIAAHAFCATEGDLEAVEKARRAHDGAWREEEGFSLTYLPFVARAVCDALHEHPEINATVAEDVVMRHRRVHLGIAVDLDHEGLIVPVVRDADTRTLRGVAREINRLARLARQRGLSPDDVSGGTFTVTNPGPMGSYLSIPIINRPQVAILSTDSVTRRPIVVAAGEGTDGIAARAVGTIGLSFDARVVELASAAAFVARVRELLATRDWSAEL